MCFVMSLCVVFALLRLIVVGLCGLFVVCVVLCIVYVYVVYIVCCGKFRACKLEV